MKLTRAQMLFVVVVFLDLAVGIVGNVAAEQVPPWLSPYLWLAWPILGGLAILFVVALCLEHRTSERTGQVSPLSDKPVSPYIVGPPIEAPEHFYGRRKQVRQFFANLNSPQPQSLSVLGIRRSGKTSFLRHVAHPEVVKNMARDQEAVITYVDLQAGIKSPSDFYRRVCESLAGYAEVGLPTAEGVMEFQSFERFLSVPHLAKRQLIILLDELEAVRDQDSFDLEFFKGLRSLVTGRRLAWVTSSYRDLYRLSRKLGADEKTSPFFNVFNPTSTLYLADLEPDEADDLVSRPAELFGIEYSAQELVALQRLAGRQPFWLQAAANLWFEARQRGLGAEETEDEVERSFATAMSRHFAYYWEHFDDDERLLLSRMAAGSLTPEWIAGQGPGRQESLRDLTTYGLAVKERDTYRVAGGVFADWIRS